MSNEDRSKFMNGATANPSASEALLRSEIAFWREMIASCETDHPRENMERMNQALGLAEFRLLQLYRVKD